MKYISCKFGGSSLATPDLVMNAIDIMTSNYARKVAVVSANGDITDYLIAGLDGDKKGYEEAKELVRKIGVGHTDLIAELSLDLDKRIQSTADNRTDVVKAWGEYASAKIMTKRMNANGIDAVCLEQEELGLFAYIDEQGDAQPDPKCYEMVGNKINALPEGTIAVIPGFYAYDHDGKLVTLPRGGSDTIGAVMANAIDAEVYENWTNVDGLFRASPKILKTEGISPQVIQEITYVEARELAYADFKLQSEALIPVMPKLIPIHVRNSGNPQKNGTLIVGLRRVPKNEVIAGVAAKTGFVPLTVYKTLMNKEVGFGLDALKILSEEMGISYEHSPTAIDDVQYILREEDISQPGKVNQFARRIREKRDACTRVEPDLAMLVVAGLGMKKHFDTDARILTALARQKIRPLMINKGASQVSTFIGVEESRADEAVKAVYCEFNE